MLQQIIDQSIITRDPIFTDKELVDNGFVLVNTPVFKPSGYSVEFATKIWKLKSKVKDEILDEIKRMGVTHILRCEKFMTRFGDLEEVCFAVRGCTVKNGDKIK